MRFLFTKENMGGFSVKCFTKVGNIHAKQQLTETASLLQFMLLPAAFAEEIQVLVEEASRLSQLISTPQSQPVPLGRPDLQFEYKHRRPKHCAQYHLS
jgi:hypothetical protein